MAKTYDVEAQMIKLQLAILKLPVDKWYKGDKFTYSRTYDYVVIQNGKFLGTVTYEKNTLTKKNFPGLKAGLFSSELKGVTVFCVESILNLGKHMEKKYRFVLNYNGLRNSVGKDIRLCWASKGTLKVSDYQSWYDRMIKAHDVEVYYEESLDKVIRAFINDAIKEVVPKIVTYTPNDPTIGCLCVYNELTGLDTKEVYEAVSKIVTLRCASLGYKLTMTPAEHPW